MQCGHVCIAVLLWERKDQYYIRAEKITVCKAHAHRSEVLVLNINTFKHEQHEQSTVAAAMSPVACGFVVGFT